MKFVSLFSGIGGFDLGLERAGMRCVGQVEIDPYCLKILSKHWPDVKRIKDIHDVTYWNLAQNDGKDYIVDVCELKNKNLPISKIYRLHILKNSNEELLECVNTVEHRNLCLHLLRKEDGGFVLADVDMLQCAETPAPTRAEGRGCMEKKTQIGKMGTQKQGVVDTRRLRLISGDAEFLPEISIHANIVDICLDRKTLLTHIISNSGLCIQNQDLMSETELHYVENATKRCTYPIELVCGGVPCQPASCAGKRRGTADDRWLWPEAIRIVREAKPTWILFENVCGLLTLEDGMVFESLLSDLEAEGYETQAFIIPACAVDAPHERKRVWIVAHSSNARIKSMRKGENSFLVSNSDASGCEERRRTESIQPEQHSAQCVGENVADTATVYAQRQQNGQGKRQSWGSCWWEPEPDVDRVAHGVSHRVDRLKSLGNAVVPQIVEAFGRAILKNDQAQAGKETT